MNRTLIAIGALLALGAAAYAQLRSYEQANQAVFSTPQGKAFLETYNALNEVYLKQVKPGDLMKGALAGMIASLEDEFAYYIPPSAASEQREELKGEFFGIGVGILPANTNGTGVRVESVSRGQPAAAAGIRPNDIITHVGTQDVTKMDLQDAVKLIRGPLGTTVQLTIWRAGSTIDLKVTRARIELLNVSSTMLPNNIGYIAISDFLNERLTEQLQRTIAMLRAQGMRALVLDLRDNPGGLVTQAIGVADSFLEKGSIYAVRDRDQAISILASGTRQASDYTGPLVVLINGSSASASEIVASSLQEHNRAKLVGEQTYGKGVANLAIPLSDGGQVNVPNREWITPKGHSIGHKGVKPDVLVEDTRYPRPLVVQGLAAPNESIKITIGNKTVTTRADASGAFRFVGETERVRTHTADGGALVNPATDAELRKALELLGSR